LKIKTRLRDFKFKFARGNPAAHYGRHKEHRRAWRAEKIVERAGQVTLDQLARYSFRVGVENNHRPFHPAPTPGLAVLNTAGAIGVGPQCRLKSIVGLQCMFGCTASQAWACVPYPCKDQREPYVAVARTISGCPVGVSQSLRIHACASLRLRVGLEKVSTISVPCKASGKHADMGDCDPRFC